jgi:hypothetical protein
MGRLDRQQVNKLVKIIPKSKFAKECVKDYGPIVRMYQESPTHKWFTCPTEEDPMNFKKWSYILESNEAEVEEIKS